MIIASIGSSCQWDYKITLKERILYKEYLYKLKPNNHTKPNNQANKQTTKKRKKNQTGNTNILPKQQWQVTVGNIKDWDCENPSGLEGSLWSSNTVLMSLNVAVEVTVNWKWILSLQFIAAVGWRDTVRESEFKQ